MKSILKLKGLLNAAFILLLITDLSLASDLIEPTRTLSSTGKSVGKLTVSSEPPRLDVKMDGTVIGETPVVLQEVGLGIHVIQVQDSEIEIYVKSGKSIKLSWFKGAFIEIPVEVKEGHKQQSGEKKEVPRKEKSAQSVKKTELEPFYWPLNPRGPIY